MPKLLSDFLLVLKKLGVVLLIFSICRVAFYIFNAGYFSNTGVAKAMLGGIRFDISAIIYLNLFFIFFSLLPFPFRRNAVYRKILNVFFILTNSIGILFNCVDIEYFKFTLKRSTFDLFTQIGTGDDMVNLIPQFIKDFWYIILLILILVFALYAINKRIGFNNDSVIWTKKNYLSQTIVFLFTIGLVVLGGRGGIQYRPLHLINATQYGNADMMPLILNTPFTLIRSYKADYLENKVYFENETERNNVFKVEKNYASSEENRDNVVLILLESFSDEFINNKGEHGDYLTPFLDSLIKESLYFDRAYANGKKSVEAVPSICSSLPGLMNNPYIFSPYSANKVSGLADILNDEGYNTSFFHGGVNGTMGFNSFSQSAGFQEYIGLNEYPFEGHEDGTWGIYDEEFFQFFNSELNKKKQPFFSLCFSLTSHHPFKLPQRYESQFPKAENSYEHVVQYTDLALKKFFASAQKESWFENTLFIITADHTAQSPDPYYRTRAGLFRVPLLFFHPKKISPLKSNDVVQQIDILPSTIDFLGLDRDFISFGSSVFRDDDKYAVQFLNNIYQIQDDKYQLEFDGDKTTAIYDLRKDSLLTQNVLTSIESSEYLMLERKLKAVIETFNDRLINNRMVAE